MTNGGNNPASNRKNGGNEGTDSTRGDTSIVGSHRSFWNRLGILASLAAVLALAVSLGVGLSKRNASAGDAGATTAASVAPTKSTPSFDAKSTAERPNVLFISVDDLNTWVGYTGRNPQTKTPNIDRLSAMGVSFTNAHVRNGYRI